MAGDGVMEFGNWIVENILRENPCVKVPEFPDELTCLKFDESDVSVEWRVYVPKGSECSECKERQGYYMDAETIRNQQERIAELEASVRAHERGMREAWSEYEKRDELIRDMARELRGLNDGGVPTDCMEHERRMRELGIEVEDEG